MRSTAFLLLLSLSACAAPEPSDTLRTDSAGIEIVTGPATDRPFAAAVGVTDTLYDPAVDSALQSEAKMVTVGSDGAGRLAVLDGMFDDRRLLRADPNGGYHQVGRHGGGPGEYGSISTLGVAPDGEILVGDFSKRSFLRFGPNDSVLPPVPWSTFGGGYSQGGGYADGGIVALISEMSESTSVKRFHLMTATDTVLLASVDEGIPKQLMYESCGVGFAGTPIFAPRPSWTGNPEQVALVTGGSYEIRIWRHGKLARIIRRGMPVRPADHALAVQEIGDGFTIVIGGRGPCTIPASEIVAQQGFETTVPAIKRIAMAADGTLWVERWTVTGEPMQRDIFDPTGGYLGTLTGDAPWPQAWLPNGDYVAVGANEDSLPVVIRYGVGGATREE